MNSIDSVKNTGRVMLKWLKRLLLLAIILGIGVLMFIIFANYSDGTRTGFITKISRKGYVFKTYEGELNTGFFANTPASGKTADNIWYFSVADKNIAEQVRKASETGQKVTLHYKQKYVKLSFRGDTEYFVFKVDYSQEVNPVQ